MTLLCPSSRRRGAGAVAVGLSGRSQRRIWPRLLPAARRRVEPRKQTEVTQSASHGSVQARLALSKLATSATAKASRKIGHKKHKKHNKNRKTMIGFVPFLCFLCFLWPILLRE